MFRVPLILSMVARFEKPQTESDGQTDRRTDGQKANEEKYVPGKIWFDLAPISFLVLLAAATAALLSGCVALLLLTADGGVFPPLLVR